MVPTDILTTQSDATSDSRTRRSYLRLLTASAGTVALAGCSDDGGSDGGDGDDGSDDGDADGDSDGGDGDGDDGTDSGDGEDDVDPASVCAEPSGDDLEAMIPSTDRNDEEIEPFIPSGTSEGGDIMTHTSDGESTDYDYDYEGGDYSADSGEYHAYVLEFSDGPPPSVPQSELYTVGFSDGEFEDDEALVYALLGDYLFLTGGPDAETSRELMAKFPDISEECAEAAYVVEGNPDA